MPVCVPANMYSYLKKAFGLSSYKTIRDNCFVVVNVTLVIRNTIILDSNQDKYINKDVSVFILAYCFFLSLEK